MLDDAMPEPVTENLVLLRVVSTRTPKSPGPRPDPPNGEGEEEREEYRALPPSKWLTRDGRKIGDE